MAVGTAVRVWVIVKMVSKIGIGGGPEVITNHSGPFCMNVFQVVPQPRDLAAILHVDLPESVKTHSTEKESVRHFNLPRHRHFENLATCRTFTHARPIPPRLFIVAAPHEYARWSAKAKPTRDRFDPLGTVKEVP